MIFHWNRSFLNISNNFKPYIKELVTKNSLSIFSKDIFTISNKSDQALIKYSDRGTMYYVLVCSPWYKSSQYSIIIFDILAINLYG